MTDPGLPDAKKFLGQHFLHDTLVLDKIISACAVNSEETVIEIGPGRGVLTRLLSERAGKVIAIEKDRELIGYLTKEFEGTNVSIIHQDILKTDWAALPGNSKLVGNLPYNIATPIIETAINHKDKFSCFYFMVQKEHAQRLTAQPGSKDYGSLSCFVQYHCEVKMLFNIPPQAFTPQPKIHSSFLKVVFKDSPHPEKFRNELFALIQRGFSHRRKMLINNLKGPYSLAGLEVAFNTLKLGLKIRAENVSLKEYIELLEELKGK